MPTRTIEYPPTSRERDKRMIKLLPLLKPLPADITSRARITISLRIDEEFREGRVERIIISGIIPR